MEEALQHAIGQLRWFIDLRQDLAAKHYFDTIVRNIDFYKDQADQCNKGLVKNILESTDRLIRVRAEYDARIRDLEAAQARHMATITELRKGIDTAVVAFCDPQARATDPAAEKFYARWGNQPESPNSSDDIGVADPVEAFSKLCRSDPEAITALADAVRRAESLPNHPEKPESSWREKCGVYATSAWEWYISYGTYTWGGPSGWSRLQTLKYPCKQDAINALATIPTPPPEDKP